MNSAKTPLARVMHEDFYSKRTYALQQAWPPVLQGQVNGLAARSSSSCVKMPPLSPRLSAQDTACSWEHWCPQDMGRLTSRGPQLCRALFCTSWASHPCAKWDELLPRASH